MVTPNNKELKMKESDLIVSKTDIKGQITYCNDSFMEFSGIYEEELLDQPHNIIRHPDMPRAIYRLMWQTLEQENEFFGFIKDLRKNGGFYWNFANVTPSFDGESKLRGYFAVRRYPMPDGIEFFQTLYQQMCEVEARIKNEQEAMDASIQILDDAVQDKGGYNEFICSFYRQTSVMDKY